MIDFQLTTTEDVGFQQEITVQIAFPESDNIDSDSNLQNCRLFDANNSNGLFAALKGQIVVVDSLASLHKCCLEADSEDEDLDNDFSTFVPLHVYSAEATISFVNLTENKLILASGSTIQVKSFASPNPAEVVDLSKTTTSVTIPANKIVDVKVKQSTLMALGDDYKLYVIDISKATLEATLLKFKNKVCSFDFVSSSSTDVYIGFLQFDGSHVVRYNYVNKKKVSGMEQDIDINSGLDPITLTEVSENKVLVTYDSSGRANDDKIADYLDGDPRYPMCLLELDGKDGNTFSLLEDFCCNDEDAQRDYFIQSAFLKNWGDKGDLCFVTSSVARYISIIDSSEILEPEDDASKGSSPMDPIEYDDLPCCGLAFDFLAKDAIAQPPGFDGPLKGKLPILWYYSILGFLVGYYVYDSSAIKNSKQYAQLNYQKLLCSLSQNNQQTVLSNSEALDKQTTSVFGKSSFGANAGSPFANTQSKPEGSSNLPAFSQPSGTPFGSVENKVSNPSPFEKLASQNSPSPFAKSSSSPFGFTSNSFGFGSTSNSSPFANIAQSALQKGSIDSSKVASPFLQYAKNESDTSTKPTFPSASSSIFNFQANLDTNKSSGPNLFSKPAGLDLNSSSFGEHAKPKIDFKNSPFSKLLKKSSETDAKPSSATNIGLENLNLSDDSKGKTQSDSSTSVFGSAAKTASPFASLASLKYSSNFNTDNKDFREDKKDAAVQELKDLKTVDAEKEKEEVKDATSAQESSGSNKSTFFEKAQQNALVSNEETVSELGSKNSSDDEDSRPKVENKSAIVYVDAYTDATRSKPTTVENGVDFTRETRKQIEANTRPENKFLQLFRKELLEHEPEAKASISGPTIYSLQKIEYPKLSPDPIISTLQRMHYDVEAEYQILVANQRELSAFVEDHLQIKHNVDLEDLSARNVYSWRLSEAALLGKLIENTCIPEAKACHESLKKVLDQIEDFKKTKMDSFASSFDDFTKEYSVVEKNHLVLSKKSKGESEVIGKATLPLKLELIQKSIRAKLRKVAQLSAECELLLSALKGRYETLAGGDDVDRFEEARAFIIRTEKAIELQLEKNKEILKEYDLAETYRIGQSELSSEHSWGTQNGPGNELMVLGEAEEQVRLGGYLKEFRDWVEVYEGLGNEGGVIGI